MDVRLVTKSGETTFPLSEPIDIGIVFDDPQRIPAPAVYTLTPDDPDSAELLLSELRDPTAQFRIRPLRTGELRFTLTVKEEEVEGVPVSQTEYRCYPLILTVSAPQQLVLTPRILPEGSTGYSIAATSENPDIVSVSAPLTITALTPGTAIVRIYLQEEPTVSVFLTVIVPSPVTSGGGDT